MENNKKKYKLFYALVMSILFLFLGIYLVGKNENLAKIIGFSNIIFWSVMILLASYKLYSKKQKI